MSGADRRFADLARLQRLAELERRREVEAACAEADRCEAVATDLSTSMERAEREHAAAHADTPLCVSRLTIAAALVTAGEDALRQGRAAWGAAQTAEQAAGGAWLQSRFRTQWFVDRDHDMRRRASARRADRADAEARLLRLTQGREA